LRLQEEAGMATRIIFALAASAFLCLSGCDQSGDDGVGGVTKGEARALNEAAEMLDSRPTIANLTNNSTQP
jgi:hypothetical protein